MALKANERSCDTRMTETFWWIILILLGIPISFILWFYAVIIVHEMTKEIWYKFIKWRYKI